MDDYLFFWIKGITAAIAVLLLVFHMLQPGIVIRSLGQRLRYVTLFAYATTVAYASAEQVVKGVDIEPRHVLGLLVTVLLVVTVAVSIRESANREP